MYIFNSCITSMVLHVHWACTCTCRPTCLYPLHQLNHEKNSRVCIFDAVVLHCTTQSSVHKIYNDIGNKSKINKMPDVVHHQDGILVRCELKSPVEYQPQFSNLSIQRLATSQPNKASCSVANSLVNILGIFNYKLEMPLI